MRVRSSNHPQNAYKALDVVISSTDAEQVAKVLLPSAPPGGNGQEKQALTSWCVKFAFSIPDKVEVAAGVWGDGETFGDPEWVSVILRGRESLVTAYNQAIALLREGMEQKWTREKYLQAPNGKPNSTRSTKSEPL